MQHFYLVLEEDGRADSFSAFDLKNTDRPKGLPNIELVLLMVCHSEVVGNVFLEKCANHVICVNKDKAVLDEATIVFTTSLY